MTAEISKTLLLQIAAENLPNVPQKITFGIFKTLKSELLTIF